MKEIASALGYLHSNEVRMIHGDLHGVGHLPSVSDVLEPYAIKNLQKNVLIDDHGHALLTDFGRSKKIGASGYATCLMAGSTAHMAPELFPLEELEFEEMDKLFSKETDVYSLAMVFFEVSSSISRRIAFN